MDYVEEPARRTPVIEEADVAVLGGGTAGTTAAIAAAREGARTVLIEKWGYVGGAAIGGLVVTVPERAGVWGIEREFYDELQTLGGLAVAPEFGRLGRTFILSAPLAKILGDTFLQRAGVVALYHTAFCDVVLREGRIEAVLVESKSGRQAVRAKVFVDCTGDADVAFRAGAPCRVGHEDGTMLPATLMYNCANVDIAAWSARPRGVKYPGRVSSAVPTEVNPGELNCWGGSVVDDGADNRGLTRIEMELRRQVLEEWQNMRKYVPGMARSFISILAEQVGVRETRLIEADYVLTEADRKAPARFDDSVGVCWEFTLPYRALLPKGVGNLLVAGRCIGAENADLIRIVPNCRTSGQAAGTAAALAAKEKSDVRAVDVSHLQARLTAQNVRLFP